MSVKKQLIKNSGWILFSRVAGALVGLAFASLLARALPPEAMGTYFLALSVAMLFSTVAGFGLPRTATRLLAEATTGHFNTNATSIAARSLFLLVMIGVVLAAFYHFLLGDWLAHHLFHSADMAALSDYIALWFILLAIRTYAAESFRGLGDIRLASLFNGLFGNSITLALVAAAFVMSINMDITHATTTVLAGLGISAATALVLLFRQTTGFAGAKNLPVPAILSISIPIMLTETMQIALAQSNIWILGAVADQVQVALYGAVKQIALLISFPFIIVNNAIPQLVTKFNADGRNDKMENLLRTVATGTFIPALVLVLGLVLFGRPLMELVYGETYGAGAAALLWLAVGQLAGVMAGPCAITLIMTGNQKINMVVTASIGLISIPMFIYLSACYGTTGAAAGAAFAITLQNGVLAILVKKYVGVNTYLSLSRRVLGQFRWSNLR